MRQVDNFFLAIQGQSQGEADSVRGGDQRGVRRHGVTPGDALLGVAEQCADDQVGITQWPR